MLLLWGQDAQGEFLPRSAFPIHHIRALVHVDGALRERCWLQREGEKKECSRREEQMSAELSSKTSPGGHQDPIYQDALPKSDQINLYTMSA